MSLSHQFVQEYIQSGQRLSPAEQSAVDDHLAACADCRDYAAFHQALLETLPNSSPAPRYSNQEIRERIRRVNDRLEKRRWPNWFFQNTLSLAGAAAALVLIVVLFIALPRMMPNRTTGSPAAVQATQTQPVNTAATVPVSQPTSQQAQASTATTSANPDEARITSPNGHWTLVYQKKLGQAELVDVQGKRTRLGAGVGAASQWIIPGRWSPDSRYLVYWQGPQSASIQADGISFWVIQVDTGKATQLSQAVLTNPAYFSWAPDGHALVFTNGGGRSAQVQKWLSLYTVTSQKVTDLIPQEKLIPGAVAWSEQGMAVAAVEAARTNAFDPDAMSWNNPAILARRIYLVNPQTGAYQRLNQDESYQDAPRWGKDGNLYFVQIKGDSAQVMAANPLNGLAKPLDGCQSTLPATAGYYGQVDWSTLYNTCPAVQAAGAAPAAQVTASVLGQAQSEAFPAVAVNGQTAFIGSQDRLIAVDFSQPTAPALAAQSEVLPGEVKKVILLPGETRPRVAASAGRYLALFDVSTPGELTLLNQSKLPGPVNALIYDIVAGRVYAGGALYNDASKGFIVMLNGSNSSPSQGNTLELLYTLQLAEPVQSLALANDVLYAAHNAGQPGVHAIPITSDGFGDPVEAIATSLPIYSMTAAGDGLYIGSDQCIWAYNLADPLHPQQTWQLSHSSTAQSAPPGKILGFELRPTAIYTAGLMSDGRPFRLAVTPPVAIKTSSIVDTASFVTVSTGYMLVAGDGANGGLEIYEVRDPQNLKRVGVYP